MLAAVIRIQRKVVRVEQLLGEGNIPMALNRSSSNTNLAWIERKFLNLLWIDSSCHNNYSHPRTMPKEIENNLILDVALRSWEERKGPWPDATSCKNLSLQESWIRNKKKM